MPDEVEAGAHDLRLAAKRVGVLHPRAVHVRGADVAAGDQAPVFAGDGDLPGLAARPMDAVVERRIAALERVDRHGAGDDRRCEHVLGAEQPGERQRGGHLGAVDQREPLLGAELGGLEPGAREPFRRRQDLAADAHMADAEQHRGQMRERREIARGAHRALRRDERVDLVLAAAPAAPRSAAAEMPE